MKNMLILPAVSALALVAAGCTPTSGSGDVDSASMNDNMATSSSAKTSTKSTVTVGGAPMYATKNIVENAQNSPIHTTLVKAVVAADLATTLSGPGPFTVFAPTDESFAALPAGTLDTLMKPENKPLLKKILTYHVLPGRVTAADIMKKIKAGGGSAALKTVEGENITATMENGYVKLSGVSGIAYVTQADVKQSNGIIHVVKGVVLPSQG